MAERPLLFEIYRLNIVDNDILSFDFMGENIRSDTQIMSVLAAVTSPEFSAVAPREETPTNGTHDNILLVGSTARKFAA